VKITPASGYSLPGDYINTVKEQNGVKYTVETFYFNNDAEFPSIYKVVFNGYNKVHATFFVIGGTIIPQPQNEPERLGYYFNKWDTNLIQSVVSDLSVIALWDPITHDVYFGPNLVVFVGVSKSYSFNEGTDEPPRTIQIKTDEKVVIKTNFDLDLPSNYGPINNTASYRDGYYEIFGDSSFPGVTFVNYKLEELDTGTFVSATIGGEYTILLEPTEKIEGYYFTGWMYKGKLVYGQMPIENKTYILYASWSPVDG
ncbi:MAG: hypothetical protein FWF07_03525, partial [Methanomassiliicoccaceae archaeon]|nr:hypothetical protein [Methanomassiliicoccaceae archaeon]